MRLQEIIGILRENFFLALTALVVLGVIFFIGYFIVYRKLLGGKKRLQKKQLLIGGLLTGYVIMVIGVTFLNRVPNFHHGMNLSLFSTYWEAWHSFSVRHWQFVILNIGMFVPFGILLPLLHSRFQRWGWTVGAALLFTFSIESFQLLTSYGNFVVDDLFNNLLGAMIGYGMVMSVLTMQARRLKRSLMYVAPAFLVVILFGSMFTYYHFKEYGNLPIASIERMDMTQAAITTDLQLDQYRPTVPLYKAPSYTKAAGDDFVVDFYARMNLDSSDMEVIYYQNEGIYWIRNNGSHSIWFYRLDGSYSYTDFSSFEEGIDPKDADEETLKEALTHLGMDIPQDAAFQKVDNGTYKWTVEKREVTNQLIDGELSVSYYSDDTIKEITNQLITYDKVKDVQIKSIKEAYQQIVEGDFRYFTENKKIQKVHVHNVEISYQLDTKGYYQPLYVFDCTVDGEESSILIPGM
jgi:glycopeptide antibiotics resistance protein